MEDQDTVTATLALAVLRRAEEGVGVDRESWTTDMMRRCTPSTRKIHSAIMRKGVRLV